MSTGEMLDTMTYNDLLTLKASSLEHLVNTGISLQEYLINEEMINTELEKHKDNHATQ